MKRILLIFTYALICGFMPRAWADSNCVLEQGMGWLNGTWHSTEGKTEFIEHWDITADGQATGYAQSRSLDTGEVFTYENIRLEKRNDSTYYVADVSTQGPVSFRLVECTSDSVKFENREHDFPNFIEYSRTGPDSFRAHVFDLQKNGFEINFKRAEG